MNIGNIKIDNNILLAPMAGVTDLPFRILCKREGCGLTYSEMISAKGIYYEDIKTKDLIVTDDIEKPYAVQIFGSDPDIMAEIVGELEVADIIDINMGCPTPKIVKNGDGSALMKSPKLAGKIIRKVSSSTKKPITVKIRKGWDDNSINAVEFAKIAQENGAKAVTVHGRTREQFYRGQADWDIIKKVKESVDIPVVGNGDVFSPQDAKKMLEYTGCDGVMIARGARGNPWIFNRTLEYINNQKLLPKVSEIEIIDKIFEHYDLMIKFKGEKISVKEMRKHISWYLKGMRNSNQLKQEIYLLKSKDEVMNKLNEYRQSLI